METGFADEMCHGEWVIRQLNPLWAEQGVRRRRGWSGVQVASITTGSFLLQLISATWLLLHHCDRCFLNSGLPGSAAGAHVSSPVLIAGTMLTVAANSCLSYSLQLSLEVATVVIVDEARQRFAPFHLDFSHLADACNSCVRAPPHDASHNGRISYAT